MRENAVAFAQRLPLPAEAPCGSTCLLPIERIRTGYSELRPGALTVDPDRAAQLPLRVVPTDDGHYEVVDGFKRLAAWRETGARLVPAIVEPPGQARDHKRLLLLANSPSRTVTALDEARVVCSLIDDDGMTSRTVGRLLGHKPDWVARRVLLGTRLSPLAQERLAHGLIGPTLAHALTALTVDEQDALLHSMANAGLRDRESLALVHAYRVADETDRRNLLRAPADILAPPAPTVSPRAAEFEAQLEGIRRTLQGLRSFSLPANLSPPERRRLEALHRSVIQELADTARCLGCAAPPSNPEVPCELHEQTLRPPDTGKACLPGGDPVHCHDPGTLAHEPQHPPDRLHDGHFMPGRPSRPEAGQPHRHGNDLIPRPTSPGDPSGVAPVPAPAPPGARATPDPPHRQLAHALT